MQRRLQMKVGIIGGTGYAGLQLVKLIDKHPEFHLTMLGSRSLDEVPISNVSGYPYNQDYCFINLDTFQEKMKTLDLVFLSLPHGHSMDWVKKAYDLKIPVIDLSGDFRLNEKSVYEKWYQTKHLAPDLLSVSTYGLAELQSKKSRLIANPGCYPTATLLGLLPLASTGLLNGKLIVVDAKSGMSGSGKKTHAYNMYCEANESIRPYATGTHRHVPEMEQALHLHGAKQTSILFSPSVIPMERGILSSIYIPNCKDVNFHDLLITYSSFYKNSKFVRLIKSMPETKWVKNTNFCDIHLVYDEMTNCIVIHSVIDNLMKGAAGQAVQNANILFGFDESTGLV